MNFPSRELDIVRLAQDVANGLTDNSDMFPAPPAQSERLLEAVSAYNTARDAAVAAQATAVQGTASKNKALRELTGLLKSDLRYAESMSNGDPSRLQLVGWGPPRSPRFNDLEIPGQVITLEVRQEGSSWVSLGWKEPFDGGPVSAYRVQRRRREGGEWTDVGTSVETAVTLRDQEPGVELEYRVIALNRAGEGPASNVVRVVL
jgi:hypothetical protein